MTTDAPSAPPAPPTDGVLLRLQETIFNSHNVAMGPSRRVRARSNFPKYAPLEAHIPSCVMNYARARLREGYPPGGFMVLIEHIGGDIEPGTTAFKQLIPIVNDNRVTRLVQLEPTGIRDVAQAQEILLGVFINHGLEPHCQEIVRMATRILCTAELLQSGSLKIPTTEEILKIYKQSGHNADGGGGGDGEDDPNVN